MTAERGDTALARRRRWLGPVAVAATALALVSVGILAQGRDQDPGSSNAQEPEMRLTFEDGDDTIVVRSTRRGDDRCEEIDVGSTTISGSHSPACLTGATMAIQTAIEGVGKTLVYGIASPAVRFSGPPLEAPLSHLRQVTVREHAAFLLVINSPTASGTVRALDKSGAVAAEASFDAGGASRLPKGVLGTGRILIAYSQEGAVWALTADGARIRLTDGTADSPDGWPTVAADGYTVLYSINAVGVFNAPVALDARDGRTHRIGPGGTTFSNDGRLVAGGVPVDQDVDLEVVVLDTATFAETGRVSLGRASQLGGEYVSELAWDAGDRTLLAAGPRGKGLWTLDPFGHKAVRLVTPDGRVDEWVLAERAVRPGTFPAVRRAGASADGGYVHVGDGRANFELVMSLPSQTPEAALDLSRVSVFEALPNKIEVGDGGRVPPREPFYLVGDGRNLFQMSAGGRLSFLFAGVGGASAPG